MAENIDKNAVAGIAPILDTNHQGEVRDIRSFLDEKYSVPLNGGGYSMVDPTYSQSQLPWGRIGIEKFSERVIPIIQSDDEGSRFHAIISAIKQACRNAISFGSGTIIIDSDGDVRVATPETSQARVDPFGLVTFTESMTGVVSVASGNGSEIFTSVSGAEPQETGSRAFSIFYHADGSHPFGSSRISPAVRSSIRAASRNKIRAEIASNFTAFPQRIINGAWEGMDKSVYDTAKKMQAGVATIMVFPRDDNGEKMDVSQLSPSDFSPFIDMQRQYATEVATGLGVDFSDLGVVTATPQSADAIYATRESMSLAVEEFEEAVTDIAQKAVDRFCETRNLKAASLIWREPALPSKASAADAAIKMAAAFPFLQNSEAMLAWAGIPANVIEAMMKEGVIRGSYNPDDDSDDDGEED